MSVNILNATSNSSFSFAFTESPLFINSTESDDSVQFLSSMNADGVASVSAPLTEGPYTLPAALLRGGFRYVTLASTSDDPLTISNVTCNITFMPQWDDLAAYTGYFSAQDTSGYNDTDFLTKLWYAGAYTVQTNTIDVHNARQNAFATQGETYFNGY